MANLKWELGVVSFHDSFEPVDRITYLKTAYTTPTDLNSKTLELDDSNGIDYGAAPFFLHGGSNGMGAPMGRIGPSTNSTYEGSIENFAIASIGSTGSTHLITLDPQTHYHNFTLPYSSYQAGDPVVFRTVPPGWLVGGRLETTELCVHPIGRTESSLTKTAKTTGSETYSSENAQKYINRYGVRLVLNTGDAENYNADRYIYRYTPINSISSQIPRYRIAWSQRVGSYQTRGGGVEQGDRSVYPDVYIETCDASGAKIQELTGEELNTAPFNGEKRLTPTVRNISSGNNYDWNTKYALIGGSSTDDEYLNTERDSIDQFWFMTQNDNIARNMYLRTNRLNIKFKLVAGKNVFFDIDDLILEHAAGTSQENYGFYEIQDYPTQGSVTWNVRSGPAAKRNVTSNNILKVNNVFGEQPAKHEITAQYNNVTRQTYDDLRVIEEWQKKNHMISLRTFNPALPDVMVGFLTLSSFNNELPELNRVSFTLKFEES